MKYSLFFSFSSIFLHGIRAPRGLISFLILSLFYIMSNSGNSSSYSSTLSLPSITHFISIKLDGNNYLNWVSQFLPVLRSHDLMGIVDGIEPCPPKFCSDNSGNLTTEINPFFLSWQKKDQYLLSWFNTTLSDSVLSSVYGLHTSRKVWTSLATRFAHNLGPELPT